MRANDYIRIGVTIVLLYLVWRHSHYSVALTLTMLSLNSEIQGMINRRLMKRKEK